MGVCLLGVTGELVCCSRGQGPSLTQSQQVSRQNTLPASSKQMAQHVRLTQGPLIPPHACALTFPAVLEDMSTQVSAALSQKMPRSRRGLCARSTGTDPYRAMRLYSSYWNTSKL